jgi:hypothetical protein
MFQLVGLILILFAWMPEISLGFSALGAGIGAAEYRHDEARCARDPHCHTVWVRRNSHRRG